MQSVRECLKVSWDEVAQKVDVYDRLDDYAANCLSIAQIEGLNSEETKNTLLRGIRNAFIVGIDYAEGVERARRELWSGESAYYYSGD